MEKIYEIRRLITSILENVRYSGHAQEAWLVALDLLFFKRVCDCPYQTVTIADNFKWAHIGKMEGHFYQRFCDAFGFITLPANMGYTQLELTKISYKLWSQEDYFENIYHDLSRCDLSADAISIQDFSKLFNSLLDPRIQYGWHFRGIHNTFPEMAMLETRLMNPLENESVYDPCSLLGEHFVASSQYCSAVGQGHPYFYGNIYGPYEKYARMNIVLTNETSNSIETYPSLYFPTGDQYGTLKKFDVVYLNNPVENIYAWLQHGICSMAEPNGRMACILPSVYLHEDKKDIDIRQKLIDLDLIETIISFPHKTNDINAYSLLILRKNKPQCLKQSIFMIDASSFVKCIYRKRTDSYATNNDNTQRIYEHYIALKATEGVSEIISAEEIAKKEWSLLPTHYIKKYYGN